MQNKMDKPRELSAVDLVSFVLYVDCKTDPLVRTLKDKGLGSLMHVQEVHLLHERPSWLSTVPCLVHTETKKGYRNEGIFEFLSTYSIPAYLRPKVAYNSKAKAKWKQDREAAEAEVFEARLAPLHVKSSQAKTFE